MNDPTLPGDSPRIEVFVVSPSSQEANEACATLSKLYPDAELSVHTRQYTEEDPSPAALVTPAARLVFADFDVWLTGTLRCVAATRATVEEAVQRRGAA